MEDNHSVEFAVKAVFHKEVYLDKFRVFFFFFSEQQKVELFFFFNKKVLLE